VLFAVDTRSGSGSGIGIGIGSGIGGGIGIGIGLRPAALRVVPPTEQAPTPEGACVWVVLVGWLVGGHAM
jgi:hypothetical protein